jgi:DMSO/TMAO reductase YedYZ molybdopterin-dependent catalytic subunit
MRIDRRRSWTPGLVVVMVILGLLGLAMVGCGGKSTSSSTSAATASTTGSTVAQVSDATTSSAGASREASTTVSSAAPTAETTAETASPTTTAATTSTTAKATTTTVKATTTTAKATTTTAKATTTTVKATTTTVKAAVVLKITGPSGTKELSMAQLKAMSAISGYGGWKNKLGNITGPMPWKGVSVRALMDLVGGGSSVTVVASDGYEAALSAGELGGGVPMYDPATGDTVTSISGSLHVIIAYSQNGSAISSSDGPLRLAFVSSAKDQVTDGSSWVKLVTTIKVK